MPKELFGIYVHWPFCLSKCPYCDFNSHVSNAIDHDVWAQSYLKEIDYIAQKTNEETPNREVTSIFFGALKRINSKPLKWQGSTVCRLVFNLYEMMI